ncbi:MAG: rhodanese-like domain-containing protein [Rehaibacterium terrae]|uniref:rhodanese-like domain-containing protein n=1 Tax=Rehaibacterium terrae TaxID=1341696 RepID=UPI00391A1186
MTLSANTLVAEARAQIRELTPEALAPRLADDIVLIDVREPAEFETGHLPGAINIPRGVLEFQVEAHPAVACVTDPALSARDRDIVVYCRTGGRSALAAYNLQRMGFTRVRSLAGGITAWREQGLPLHLR